MSSSIATATTTTTTNTNTNTTTTIPDQPTLKKLKVPELKDLLSTYSLPLSGKKEDLVQRLIDHSQASSSSSFPAVPELDFDPEDLALPTTTSVTASVKPRPTSSPVRPPSPSKTATAETDVIVKPSGFKFTKLSFAESKDPSTPAKQIPLPPKPVTPFAKPVAPVPVNTPSTPEDIEKRKQRAARFGLAVTEDVKRADRAKRFGESLSTPMMSANVSGSGSAPASASASKKAEEDAKPKPVLPTSSAKPSLVIDAETLKRRQERFGSASSSEKMSPLALSDEDKKRKRAEKYGTSSESPKTAEAPRSPEKKIKV